MSRSRSVPNAVPHSPVTAAIVPIRGLGTAKRRLAGVLSDEIRHRLVLGMLREIVTILSGIEAISHILVLTSDDEVAAEARGCGASVVSDGGAVGLNRAIGLGVSEAVRLGCERVIVVPGDVPLTTAVELAALLGDGSVAPAVAIARSADGKGTNALVLCPPDVIAPAFGEDSFARHGRLARTSGCDVRLLELEGLGHDIDTVEDLELLEGRPGFEFVSGAITVGDHGKEAAKVSGRASGDRRIGTRQALDLADCNDLELLSELAQESCLAGHGTVVTFSRKVFIPLTQLCRDVCHYCTFAHAPRRGSPAYLSREQVLEIARRGAAAGCKEALFTLGDKPELRYAAARTALSGLGHPTTLDYLEECARLVFDETGLLPHINAGVMDVDWIERLKHVSVSQGLMVESTSPRLMERGGPHFGSPDKAPDRRLATLDAAGRAEVPFTTGLLIGIGETRVERIETLLAIRDCHERYGHVQEVIVQNFRAKPGTRMADAREPDIDEHVWTIAVARLILGPDMNIQAPPNLRPGNLSRLVAAGINDWGGVSPVTPDHVNPEAPWPHLDDLSRATDAAGRSLVERLAVYPEYLDPEGNWLDVKFRRSIVRAIDADGLVREDNWAPGDAGAAPPAATMTLVRAGTAAASMPVARILEAVADGDYLGEEEIASLFSARGADFAAVTTAADTLRKAVVGDTVTYVVTRNINYTNVCSFGCQFCAFSKGRLSTDHRDKPYDLDLKEIAGRTVEAWERGATEVCLQGGIGPRYTGETYLGIVEAVKAAAPDIHVHAFSPLEIWHGATTLGLDLHDYLSTLREAGLSSLPGTAAEILDDEVRRILCPDKINTEQWLEVMQAAHDVGLRSTATMMFGHVDRPVHWVRHLLRVRTLQSRTGGFTEFVPLPFVHMESPIYLKGLARRGPTFRESILMHSIARLVLHPLIANIQASWVKMGPAGAALCLDVGCNDLGGTLMNESITRAAGAGFGQEMTPGELVRLIHAAGRIARQRSTDYGTPPSDLETVAPRHCHVNDW
jgi:FO synthase